VQQLLAVDIGFSPADRTSMALGVGGPRFQDDAVVFNTWQRVHESVRAIPGIAAASLTSQLPLSDDFDAYGLHFEGSEGAATSADTDAFRFAVTPDYANTMGLIVRQGRFLEPGDTRLTQPVLVINEGLARRMGVERSPLGRRVRIGGGDTPWRTVVGVVNDVQHPTLDAAADGQIYLPLDQNVFADGHVRLVTRSSLPAAAITPTVRAAVAGIDPEISIADVRSLDEVVALSARQRLFARLLFQVFSMAAVVLSAIGIFGVMSGLVNERTREIGVRSALGATQSRILREFLGQGAALAGIGITIGTGGALLLAGALRPLVFGISPRDPVTLVGVSAGLAVVALVATWWPAYRAARMDAATALRSE
jgi:predicted permease